MRLGLLPEVAALDADGDIAEGLEPVFVNGIQTPFWQSHVRWFRWFASGDAALLLVLLLAAYQPLFEGEWKFMKTWDADSNYLRDESDLLFTSQFCVTYIIPAFRVAEAAGVLKEHDAAPVAAARPPLSRGSSRGRLLATS